MGYYRIRLKGHRPLDGTRLPYELPCFRRYPRVGQSLGRENHFYKKKKENEKMKSLKGLAIVLAVFTVFGFALSCENPAVVDAVEEANLAGAEAVLPIVPQLFTDIGQVKYIDLEGGFYGIVGSNGNYDPINLPKEYMVDGLWVMIQAQVLYDYASIHMWGTLIRIYKIEKIEGKIISDVGTVKQVGIQGRPFIIEGKKGTYQPINLPLKYQVPGLVVKFTAKLRTDIIIIPRLWPLIEILTISVVTAPPQQIVLGQEFKLPVTNTAVEPNNRISFTFDSVASDSRCPSDVVCVWAGEAIALVTITIGDVKYGQYKISTYPGRNTIVVGKFSFTFVDLYPYPSTSADVAPNYIGYFLVDYAYVTTQQQ